MSQTPQSPKPSRPTRPEIVLSPEEQQFSHAINLRAALLKHCPGQEFKISKNPSDTTSPQNAYYTVEGKDVPYGLAKTIADADNLNLKTFPDSPSGGKDIKVRLDGHAVHVVDSVKCYDPSQAPQRPTPAAPEVNNVPKAADPVTSNVVEPISQGTEIAQRDAQFSLVAALTAEPGLVLQCEVGKEINGHYQDTVGQKKPMTIFPVSMNEGAQSNDIGLFASLVATVMKKLNIKPIELEKGESRVLTSPDEHLNVMVPNEKLADFDKALQAMETEAKHCDSWKDTGGKIKVAADLVRLVSKIPGAHALANISTATDPTKQGFDMVITGLQDQQMRTIVQAADPEVEISAYKQERYGEQALVIPAEKLIAFTAALQSYAKPSIAAATKPVGDTKEASRA